MDEMDDHKNESYQEEQNRKREYLDFPDVFLNVKRSRRDEKSPSRQKGRDRSNLGPEDSEQGEVNDKGNKGQEKTNDDETQNKRTQDSIQIHF